MTAQKKNPQSADVPVWEWVVAALGALLFLSTIALLAFEAATKNVSPPDIVLESEAPAKASGGYLVPVRAVNRGSSTASRLKIAGRLLDRDSHVIEEAEIEFDYLAAHSEDRGGLIFRNDPRNFELKLIAKGYVSP